MSGDSTFPGFAVVPGRAAEEALQDRKQVIGLIERAYLLHGESHTVNPPSYFLRFPDNPANRIIALPAAVRGDTNVAGIKWISSFPANVGNGLPRASAVLVLNDLDTGYPLACMESSIISATRTAASAALAADRLAGGGDNPVRLGIFGSGLIARYIHTYLAAVGFTFAEIGVHDVVPDHAKAFADYLGRSATGAPTRIHATPEGLISSADIVVFATTAGTPHVLDRGWFDHHPLVLHISLRDLAPEVVLAATNIVDDVEHCLKADTSVHLAEQMTGSRDHVHATLYDVLTGTFGPPADRTVVFSPFGLGVLDLVLADHVLRYAIENGDALVVPDFFHERDRYGRAAQPGPRSLTTAPDRCLWGM